ncbi:protein FAR1-RELATED SEQUENCE 5-like [Vicia villosa]|uniref:protein FAR1-RELATED SEQUENCE 5-like n=1 Tax=Vicia villosa TaxID=3911 RepID=UPI00273AEB80|nr:protein FAR1-RELATED SEQUENCE 5-like [Vicia villosa]
MTDIEDNSTIISSHDILETDCNIDYADIEIPINPPLEPYEGMEFMSIDDAKSYYTNAKRQKQLEKGDAQLMLSYFKDCQLKNPGFFYAFQMDVEGQLANCFWVDSRSRMAYKYFGDVVTFDPTYLTNRYKMPFVPFTGVNHHQQSILFGCALLWDETEDSFFWLLSTWVEATNGVCPKTIITDQDMAITNAVARVFPKVNHHYCMWHIQKKVPEYLNYIYHEHGEFKNQFHKCIHQSITVEEFDSDWEAMIDKYELQDNKWLEKIYFIREKWIPAFVRQDFCAGMSTTQRSESINSFFKDFLNSSTPLSKFVTQYEKALDARYNSERHKTFKTLNSKPLLRTLYPMEEEVSKIYTRKMFRIFQDELVSSQMFIAEKIDFSTEVSTYKVHEICKEKPNYHVTFNVISKEYVLRRWTINAKKEKSKGLAIQELHEGKNKDSSTSLFNSVMVHSLELSERASRSPKHHDIAIQALQNVIVELDQLDLEESKEGLNNSNIEVTSNLSNNNMTLRDPPVRATKGRPRTLRMKGSLELVKSVSSTCSYCKKKGHNKRKCPSLIQSRCNITNGQLSNTGAADAEDSSLIHSQKIVEKDVFPEAYEEAINKFGGIDNAAWWNEGIWCWNQLCLDVVPQSATTHQEAKISALLQDVMPSMSGDDEFNWLDYDGDGFTVKSSYELMDRTSSTYVFLLLSNVVRKRFVLFVMYFKPMRLDNIVG